MNNKEFLKEYPLAISIQLEDLNGFREVLSKANESYPIEYREELYNQFVNFYITICTTNFAYGYWHIGCLHNQFLSSKK